MRYLSPSYLLVAMATLLLAPSGYAQRQLENLGRGVVAVRSTTSSAYIGWRLLGNDPENIAFNLYRSANGAAAVKLNATPISAATNYVDTSANFALNNAYHVRPVINGVEQAASAAFTLPANAAVRQFLNIPLSRPAGGTTPDGVAYTYSPGDASVGDLTGDGEYEFIVKWDPSNAKDNSQSGYTGNVFIDAYKLDGTMLWRLDLGINIRAGAHYTQFIVYDFDGDGRAEIALKTAPGTIDGQGTPVLLPGHSASADYRNSSGYILTGPEYLTVFDGLTGAQRATVNYVPGRGTVSSWGDSYGNRVDRFLAGVAYVDGQRPSLIMSRGYYTRAVIVAWDFRDGQLTRRWTFDSDDGTAGNSLYRGQGAHSLSIADVDGDGRDEIIFGAATINHDGKGLYSTRLGHGDAQHVSDMDPDRPGLEIFMIYESPGSNGGIGAALTDAATGQIIWSTPATSDVGRGVAFNIDPRHRGFEAWASNSGSVYNVKGEAIPTAARPAYNFGVYWTDSLNRQLLDSNRISQWNTATNRADTILTATGASSINGTKATPMLSADVLGDWREEVIWRGDDNASLRIYLSTTVSSRRFYTFMHDPQYRVAIAWQNVAYNQPPHPSFYIGPDMAPPPRAPIFKGNLIWKGGSGSANTWSAATSSWTRDGAPSAFVNGDSTLFDLSGTSGTVTLSGTLSPSSVIVHNPLNHVYTFAGSGSLAGSMPLVKAGRGTLAISNANSFTGPTRVEDGILVVNGSLASPVTVEGRGRLAGTGSLNGGLTARRFARISPGPVQPGFAATLSVSGALTLQGASIEMDLAGSPAGVSDRLSVAGNLSLSDVTTITIHKISGWLDGGLYPLITYSGSLTGSLQNLVVTGLGGTPGSLVSSPGMIALQVIDARPPVDLTWAGTSGNWNTVTENWRRDGASVPFVTGDRVRFDDTGSGQLAVNVAEAVYPGSVEVDAVSNYNFGGPGSINGTGGLTKLGSGRLTITSINSYTGPTVIAGGQVQAALTNATIAGPLGAASADPANLVLAGGGLRLSGTLATDRGATLSGVGGTIDALTGTTSISGQIVGSGALAKIGSGGLTLSGNNSYSGGTSLAAGTLTIAHSSALGSGPITLSGGTWATGGFSPQNAVVVAGNATISGGNSGGSHAIFNVSGSGELTLNATSVFDLEGNMGGFSGRILLTGSGSFRLFGSAGSANADWELGTRSLGARSGTAFALGSLSGGPDARLNGAGGYTATVTYTVGGKGTDSTFEGIINNGTELTNLVKVGAGVLTLSGQNAYTGTTTVRNGVLLVNGSLANSAVTVESGARIGGAGSIAGAVTVQSGGGFVFDPGAAAPLVLVNVTLQGSQSVSSLGDQPLPEGIYTFATYSGSLSGTPNFSWTGPTAPGQAISFQHSAGTFQVTIANLGRPAGSIHWTGANSGAWDTATFNWSLGNDAARFQSGDAVTFDENAAGTKDVTVAGPVTPASVTFDHGGFSFYTLTSSGGGISGPTGLTKQGEGTLRLFGANAFSGPVAVLGGTLTLGVDSGGNQTVASLGSGPLLVENAELRFGGNSGGVVTHNLTNALTLTNGQFTAADGRQNLNGPINSTGESLLLTQYNGKDIHLQGLLSGAGTLTVDDIAGNFGEGVVHFSNAANSFAGTLVVNPASTGRAGGAIRINHPETLRHATVVNLSPRPNAVSFSTASAELGGLAGSGSFAMPSGLLTVGSNAELAAFSGALDGSGGLTKVGVGEWTLSGAHTYAGPTIVSAGWMRLTGSLTNASSVTIRNGATLELTGTLSVNQVVVESGGRLIGGGTINAELINDGLVLADGPSSVWTFNGSTLNRGVMRFTRGASLTGSGAFANLGTLDLITAGGGLPSNFTSSGVVLDPAAVRIESVALDPAGIPQIYVFGYEGHLFQLQCSADLSPDSWQNVGLPQAGTGGPLLFTAPDDTPATADSRFFRVVLLE
jgi:fibronectin-binding autotransporter adhesin